MVPPTIVEDLVDSGSSGYDTSDDEYKALVELKKEPEVKLNGFYKHTKALRRSQVTCSQIPLVIIVFVTFMTVSVKHFMVEPVHELEIALEEVYLTKKTKTSRLSYSKIHSRDDYWEWMKEVFIPTTFASQFDVTGKRTAKARWGNLAEYNKIIGGVRLIQTRGSTKVCEEAKLVPFYGSSCNDPGTNSKKYFGYHMCNTTLRGEVVKDINGCIDPRQYSSLFNASKFYAGKERETGFEPQTFDLNGNEIEGFQTFFDSSNTYEQAKLQLEYLKERKFVDRQTTELHHVVTVFNGELNLFGEITLTLKFENGGYIRDRLTIGCLPLHPYQADSSMYVYDCVWYIVLSFLIIREMYDLSQIGFRVGIKEFWTLVNWLTIIMCIYLSFSWHLDIVTEADRIAAAIEAKDVIKTGDFEGDSSAVHLEVTEIQERIHHGIYLMKDYRVYSVVAVLLLLLQLFEVFLGNPRLATMLLTFSRSFIDILHFLFVASFIFFAYSYTGYILFGHQMENFRSLQSSLTTCFLFLFGSDLDVYHELKYVQRLAGPIWFFSYLVFCGMVLINCFMAIILGSYEKSHEMASKRDISTIKIAYIMVRDLLHGTALGSAIGWKGEVTSQHLWLLLKMRVKADRSLGKRKPNKTTGKLERWVNAHDLVRASKNWRIPKSVHQNGGCCIRFRSSAFLRKHREAAGPGGRVSTVRQFSQALVGKIRRHKFKGRVFPPLSYERAKEAIMFFHDCHNGQDDEYFEADRNVSSFT